MNEPARLRHDHRGLAAAGGGHYQIAVFVDDDSSSLLVGERPGLDAVEELPRTLSIRSRYRSGWPWREGWIGSRRKLRSLRSIRSSEVFESASGQ